MRGALLITLGSGVIKSNLAVYVNSILRNLEYDMYTDVYTTHLYSGDTVNLVLTTVYEANTIATIRKDYSTIDINGDNGIRTAPVSTVTGDTSGGTISSTFVVTPIASDYNFEYITRITTNDPAQPNLLVSYGTPIPSIPVTTNMLQSSSIGYSGFTYYSGVTNYLQDVQAMTYNDYMRKWVMWGNRKAGYTGTQLLVSDRLLTYSGATNFSGLTGGLDLTFNLISFKDKVISGTYRTTTGQTIPFPILYTTDGFVWTGNTSSADVFTGLTGYTTDRIVTTYKSPTQVLATYFSSTNFSVSGNSSNTYGLSSDGINWVKYTLPGRNIVQIKSVIWDGTKWVLLVEYSNSTLGSERKFLVSPNGINWTIVDFISGNITWSTPELLYLNSLYIIQTRRSNINASNVLYWSSDLITWTTSTVPNTFFGTSLIDMDMTYFKNNYIADRRSGSNYLFGYSTDLINWTGVTGNTVNIFDYIPTYNRTVR